MCTRYKSAEPHCFPKSFYHVHVMNISPIQVETAAVVSSSPQIHTRLSDDFRYHKNSLISVVRTRFHFRSDMVPTSNYKKSVISVRIVILCCP